MTFNMGTKRMLTLKMAKTSIHHWQKVTLCHSRRHNINDSRTATSAAAKKQTEFEAKLNEIVEKSTSTSSSTDVSGSHSGKKGWNQLRLDGTEYGLVCFERCCVEKGRSYIRQPR